MIGCLKSKRPSIDISQLDLNSFDIEKSGQNLISPSKKDLFLFNRKKNEVSEFIKAKSVVNLDEIKDDELEVLEEKE